MSATPLPAVAFEGRALLAAALLGAVVLYLAFDAVRPGPRRDRKGRFVSKRRHRLRGLLKLAVLGAVVWVGATTAGFV